MKGIQELTARKKTIAKAYKSLSLSKHEVLEFFGYLKRKIQLRMNSKLKYEV